jgi:hypothetical protein
MNKEGVRRERELNKPIQEFDNLFRLQRALIRFVELFDFLLLQSETQKGSTTPQQQKGENSYLGRRCGR